MNEAKTKPRILQTVAPEKLYSSSILRVARHLWRTEEGCRVLDLADELQKRPEAVVVGVVDDGGKYRGIVQRDRLFALIGKPFGREVLQRSVVREVMEVAPTFHAHDDVFAVAQEIRARESDGKNEAEAAYFALVNDGGVLQGLLSAQDLAEHLSRITQDDIELAGRLQERLLAGAELPESGACRVAAWSRPAKGVGGDFYFVRELGGGKVFAALCDVSGKGVAASLIVSLVWGILRGHDFKHGLRGLLVSLNRAIVETFHMEKYLTGFFMVYESESRRLFCADMGHSHVLLVRGGRALAVRSGRQNLPIGIESTIEPAIQSVRLKEGDALFVYSDGTVEQENAEGVEFGERRLARVLLSPTRSPLDAGLKEALPTAIDGFRAGTPQQDDMSFLLLVARSEAEGPRPD